MTRIRACIHALLVAVPVHVQAQAPAAVRDSIAALRDTTALRRIALAAAAPARPIDHVRRGFAFLRLYEITDARADAEGARAAFERALDLAPGDVYAQLGLGLSLAGVADAEDADPPAIVAGRAFAAALGRDARSRARRALERALALEPALADAATALADVALRTRDVDALVAARAALDRSADGGRVPAAVSLARARVALALGEPAAAIDPARAAVDAGIGGVQSAYVLAVALLRVNGREEEGTASYFRAARAIDGAEAALFADDLRELWTDAQRARWNALDGAGRRAFLARFWEVRAALAGTTVAERLAEHQRRLAVAFERYRRKTRWGAPPTNALLLDRPDGRFDDRGVIHIRHGPPARVIRTIGRSVRPNESWVYEMPAGDPTLLHFVEYGSVLGAPGGGLDAERGGYADYVLVYELPCEPAWVAERVAYDHRLNPLLHRCSTFDRKSISIEVRRDAYAALATDSHAPPFASDLAADYDVYAFRRADGSTELVAAAAAPAARLATRTTPRQPTRGLALSLNVVDTATQDVHRADTVFWSAADTIVAHASVAVPPLDGALLRVVVRDAAEPVHGRLHGRTLDVPAFGRDSLALSDVVLAAAVAPDADDPLAWRRGDAALTLAPGATFDAAAFRVFFEIYDLPPGEPFAIDIRVEPRGRGIGGALRRLFGARPPLHLRFDDTAAADPDAVVRVLRDVRADLPAGRWTLTVEVTDARGRSAHRSRTFHIAESR